MWLDRDGLPSRLLGDTGGTALGGCLRRTFRHDYPSLATVSSSLFGLALVVQLARGGLAVPDIVVRGRPVGAVAAPVPSIGVLLLSVFHFGVLCRSSAALGCWRKKGLRAISVESTAAGAPLGLTADCVLTQPASRIASPKVSPGCGLLAPPTLYRQHQFIEGLRYCACHSLTLLCKLVNQPRGLELSPLPVRQSGPLHLLTLHDPDRYRDP